MNIENNKDKMIIEKVLNLRNEDYVIHKYFTDGVSSRVILLNNKYLIKQNEPETIKSEVTFFKTNTSSFFQKLIYFEDDFSFVVYEFIPGNVMKKPINTKKTFEKIISIVKKYAEYQNEIFGYLDEPTSSWSNFLIQEFNSCTNIPENLIDKNKVFSNIEKLKRFKINHKLLHGDLGTHNFIEENGELVGVIDPQAISGDLIYDILFCYASNISFINNISLDELYQCLNEPEEKIKLLLSLVIYFRISRCLKYHPQDLNIYVNLLNSLL